MYIIIIDEPFLWEWDVTQADLDQNILPLVIILFIYLFIYLLYQGPFFFFFFFFSFFLFLFEVLRRINSISVI